MDGREPPSASRARDSLRWRMPLVVGTVIVIVVGTFLGVFLAYGLVGPIAVRLKGLVDDEAQFYHVIRDILVAHLHGNSAQVSVEIGRGSVPSE